MPQHGSNLLLTVTLDYWHFGPHLCLCWSS